jgi:hypothetical protein
MRNQLRLLSVALALTGCSLLVDPKAKEPLKTADGFCNSVQDVLQNLGCDVVNQSYGAVDPTAAAQLLAELRTGCQNLQAAVTAGRFTYDEANAKACIDALQAGGCKAIFGGAMGAVPPPLACAKALKGSVGFGGSCQVWNGTQGGTGVVLNECASGNTCLYSDPAACPGTCGHASILGGPCGVGNVVCNPSDTSLYCDYSAHVCRNYLYPSLACNNSIYLYCDSNYYYCSASTGPGTCQSLPTSGPCLNGYQCSSGYFCSAGSCAPMTYPGSGVLCASTPCQSGSFCNSTTGFCSYYSNEGASCSGGNQCGYPPNVPAPLYCDSGGYCRRYPTTLLGRGADCFGVPNYCGDGLFCDTANLLGQGANTCQPLRTSGTCPMYTECAPGYSCLNDASAVPAGPYCKPLGAAGAACNTMNGPLCLSGTFCKTPSTTIYDGVCTLLPGDGQPCATSGMRQCAYGTIMDSTSGCVCKGPLPEGSACTYDSQCGFQVNGTKCIAGTCQSFVCEAPVGWLAGSAGPPT